MAQIFSICCNCHHVGTYIRITWIVRNDGVGTTDSTFWYDRVYWSTDQYLGKHSHSLVIAYIVLLITVTTYMYVCLFNVSTYIAVHSYNYTRHNCICTNSIYITTSPTYSCMHTSVRHEMIRVKRMYRHVC